MGSTGDTLERLGTRDGNAIGFLRLAAALSVVIGHSFVMGGYRDEPVLTLTHNQWGPGRTAVDLFFVLSGFLIASSYDRLHSPLRFAWHRFLRIWPGWIVCVALTGLVLAPCFGAGAQPGYVWANLFPIGDLARNAGPLFGGSVNSSLWTLPWEVLCYTLVLALGLTRLLRAEVVLVMLAAAWTGFGLLIYSFPGADTSPAVTSGLRLMTFFLAGMLAWLLRGRIRLHWTWLVGAVGTLALATFVGTRMNYSGGLFYTAAPLPFSYVVLYAAARLPFRRVNTSRDLSYGTYIYGALVLHMLAGHGLPWLVYISSALALVLIVASASWILVEEPALRSKSLFPSRPQRHPELDLVEDGAPPSGHGGGTRWQALLGLRSEGTDRAEPCGPDG